MKNILCILIFVVLVASLGAVYHKTGGYQLPGTLCNDVDVEGDRAYLLIDDFLKIFAVSGWGEPVELGQYNSYCSAEAIEVVGNYAYVAWGMDGFKIVDVSNPTSPTLAGCYASTLVDGVRVIGNYAYLKNGNADIEVLDISVPSSPTLVYSYNTPNNDYNDYNDIAILGNIAYVSKSGDGIRVMDISHPNAPQLLNTIDTPYWAYELQREGKRLYLSAADALMIYSLADPVNPVLLSRTEIEYPAFDIQIDHNRAYISWKQRNLSVLDVSDPAYPLIIGGFSTNDMISGFRVSGDRAYLAEFYSGLWIVDLSQPENNGLLTSHDTQGFAKVIDVEGDYAYLADGSGLRIFEMIDPAQPHQIGNLNDTPGATWVSVEGNYAYLASPLVLRVIDVSNPANPTQVASHNPSSSGMARAVEVEDGVACLAFSSQGVYIYDVSNPQSPVLVTLWPSSFEDYIGMVMQDQTVYLVRNAYGFSMLDVSNPSQPVYAGSHYQPRVCTGVAVKGNTVYYANLENGLRIIDVSDPTSTQMVNSIQPHSTSWITDCFVQGDSLWVLDNGWNEISVYDITSPQNPLLRQRRIWNHSSWSAKKINGKMITANGEFGIHIHHLGSVESQDPVQNPVPSFSLNAWPNPFKHSTRIAFELEKAAPVTLSIYNLRGQMVKTMALGQKAAGSHQIDWDGRDARGSVCPAGIYHIRVRAGERKYDGRVVLVR
jgi:hypothetical protein